MTIIDKPWGKEEILETNQKYTVKRLTMLNGHKCSLQYHKFKTETIYVISGELTIYVGDIIGKNATIGKSYMSVGQTITIDPFRIHRMSAESGDVVYLECSTSELNDVIRIEDDYERDKK